MSKKINEGNEEYFEVDERYFMKRATIPGIKDVDERNELAVLAQNGDVEARNKLFYSLNALMMKWTNRYYSTYSHLAIHNSFIWNKDNVYSLVVEGVLLGISKFDINRENASLIKCCESWVMAVVMREVEKCTSRNVGVELRGMRDGQFLRREVKKFFDENGVEPSKDEVREMVSTWSNKRFELAWTGFQAKSFILLSGDDVLGKDDKRDFWEVCEDESVDILRDVIESRLRESLNNSLEEYYRRSSDLVKSILVERVLAETPMFLDDVGRNHGVSGERVRQIQLRVIKNLRAILNSLVDELRD